MDITATVINGVVVGLVGLVLAIAGKGRFDRLETRIDRMEDRLDARISAVETRLTGVDAKIDSGIGSLRADVTQLALAVGAKPRARNA